MSEIYTVSAKTVDEAMDLASKLYGASNKEISYDIVSLPKKGFLGIGSKDAVIRVTVEDDDDNMLSSIVNEIKSYKSQTAPESGYYTNDPEPQKKDKKESHKKENAPEKAQKKEPAKEVQAEKPQAQPEKKAQPKPQQKKASSEKPQQKKAAPEKQTTAPKAAPEKAPAKKEDEKRHAVSRDEMDFAKNFINSMIRDMGLSATAVEMEGVDGVDYVSSEGVDVCPAINIVGDDTGILIGHHGETLDAVQYLVNLALFRRANSSKSGRDNIKITVDIENYRAKREETLRALARRMAARAVKYKKNVFLEPMNPYERRIIHSELQEYPDVDTHSVGSDTNRKIIITYEGADKPVQKNNRRRNGRRHSNGNNRPADEMATPVGMPLPTLDDIN